MIYQNCKESKARCYVKLRKLNPELLPNPQEGGAEETLEQTEVPYFEVLTSLFSSILTVKMKHCLSTIQAGVSSLPEDENSSKLFMKKNCVVKIAKMAWLDEVSQRERGQKKTKVKRTDVDMYDRLLNEDN